MLSLFLLEQWQFTGVDPCALYNERVLKNQINSRSSMDLRVYMNFWTIIVGEVFMSFMIKIIASLCCLMIAGAVFGSEKVHLTIKNNLSGYNIQYIGTSDGCKFSPTNQTVNPGGSTVLTANCEYYTGKYVFVIGPMLLTNNQYLCVIDVKFANYSFCPEMACAAFKGGVVTPPFKLTSGCLGTYHKAQFVFDEAT